MEIDNVVETESNISTAIYAVCYRWEGEQWQFDAELWSDVDQAGTRMNELMDKLGDSWGQNLNGMMILRNFDTVEFDIDEVQ